MTYRVRPWLSATGISVLFVTFVFLACSDPGGQGNGCQSTGADVTINAQNNLTFDKPTLTVTLGQRVCWQNFGSVTHTVTSDPASPADSTWNLDATLTPNTVVIHTFTKSGDYPYHCFFHVGSNMRGTIHVP